MVQNLAKYSVYPEDPSHLILIPLVAIIKCYRLATLNDRNLFSCHSGIKSKNKVLRGLNLVILRVVSDQPPCEGPHALFSEPAFLWFSSSIYQDTNYPTRLRPSLSISWKLNYILKGPFSKYNHNGLKWIPDCHSYLRITESKPCSQSNLERK